MKWRHIELSVQGASHIRSGRENQDSLAVAETQHGATVAAVSDGHGGAKYVRSKKGSEIAVQVITALLTEVAASEYAGSVVKRQAEEDVPRRLVANWTEFVKADLAERPLTDEELRSILDADGEAACDLVRADPVLAYGATCLAVLATKSYLLFVQLGDGDIVVVSSDGAPSRPVAADARLIANETTSLCTPNAWRDVCLVYCPLCAQDGSAPDGVDAVDSPVLVMLSTDGLSNSYRTGDDFVKVGVDLLQMCRHEGMKQVGVGLKDWLTEVSTAGSGDDVTIAILKCDEPKDTDVLQETIVTKEGQLQSEKSKGAALAEEIQRLERLHADQAEALRVNARRVRKLTVCAVFQTLILAMGAILWVAGRRS